MTPTNPTSTEPTPTTAAPAVRPAPRLALRSEPASVPDAPGPADQRPLEHCLLCGGRRLHYAFAKDRRRIVACTDCRLLFQNPQPSDADLAAIYTDSYFVTAGMNEAERADAERTKAATARGYLDLIARYRGRTGGRLLEVGFGGGELLVEAGRAGFEVAGVEFSQAAVDRARARVPNGELVAGPLESAGFAAGSFDVCVMADLIEHVRDPHALLAEARRLLKPDGVLFVATPSLASWSARALRQNWMEFKPEHLTYFDPHTIQTLLYRAGYEQTIVRPGWKVLNLDYVAGHFRKFPVPLVGPLVLRLTRLLPAVVRRRPVPVVASGMAVLSRPAAAGVPDARRRVLSVVVPAFNEAATLEPMLQSLLDKRLRDLDVEVILVESNSTDGTREIARRYADHPRVRLVLEDEPRGKWHAVRTGLRHATGDVVLIQDADLEYDMEDYDALLEPITGHRQAFVLGSRHGGRAWWKMRQFTQQWGLSMFLNCGHWFFTTLLNVLFGQRLRDPFTMYKVFRRDCLYGLEFRCDRFDFDHELLVKLVRKGYRPVEIPVNYRSRSFREGKKVSVLRDPWTWIRALAWLRFTRVDPLAVVAARAAAEAAATPAERPAAEPAVRQAA